MPEVEQTRQLLRRLTAIDPPRVAVLACSDAALPRIPRDGVGVRLAGCVLGLGIEFPAQVLAWGVAGIDVVACPADPEGTDALVGSWREVLDGVGMAAETATQKHRGRDGPVFDLARPAIPRRLAFGLGRRGLPPFDLDQDEPGRGLAAFAILRAQGRARMPSRSGPRDAPASTGVVALGLSAAGCTACGVCVRACPAHALELVSNGGVTVLAHTSDRCRAHRACISLCPQHALRVEAELTTLDLATLGRVELARVETAVCGRCGTNHPATEGSLCPACAFRASSAFGSRLPPGYPSR